MKFQINVEIDDAALDVVPLAVGDQHEWVAAAIARSVWQPWGGFCDLDAIQVRRVVQCDHFLAHGPGGQSITRCSNTHPDHVEHFNEWGEWSDEDEQDTSSDKYPRLAFLPRFG